MTPEQYVTRVRTMFEKGKYTELLAFMARHGDNMSPQLSADTMARLESLAKTADIITDPAGRVQPRGTAGGVRIVYLTPPTTTENPESLSVTRRDHRFDFTFSFGESRRETARQIRDSLEDAGFTVFFDEGDEHEMADSDGGSHWRDTCARESRYCVVLISRDYDQRDWLDLERESIQSRELHGERGMLVPVVTDTYRPAWLPESRITFDLSRRSVAELIEVLARLPGVESSVSRAVQPT